MIANIRSFLALFDRRSLTALRRMTMLSSLLAAADFGVFVLFYPVFGSLISGSASQSDPAGLVPTPTWSPRLLLLVATALLVLRAFSEFAMKAWWTKRAGEAEVQLGSRLLKGYAFAPYSFHLQRNSSDLLARAVAEVNMASTSGLNGLAGLGADITSVVAIGLALCVVSPIAALAVGSYIAVLTLVFLAVNQSVVRRQTDRYTRQVGQTYSRAATMLRGIRELTVAGARQDALNSITASRAEMVQAQQRLLLLGDMPRMVLEVGLYVAMFATLAVLVSGDEAPSLLPTIALFVLAAMRILPAAGRSLRTLTSLRAGMELGTTLRDELDQLDGLRNAALAPTDSLPDRGALSVSDLSFSYEGSDELVLDRVSLDVPFGSFVGVVGPSGAGKSTLLGLLLGLLSPHEGKITYGGHPIGLANPAWFHRVAYVPQDVFVLDQSVRSNVALGDPNPDDTRVVDALKGAHLWDVVSVMERGMGTSLGESGSRLSVGQRQRLGIARALYRRARVLMLDEPTAALDSESERRIVETVMELRGRGDVTILLISHRLSAIAGADRIIRLERRSLLEIEHAEGPEAWR